MLLGNAFSDGHIRDNRSGRGTLSAGQYQLETSKEAHCQSLLNVALQLQDFGFPSLILFALQLISQQIFTAADQSLQTAVLQG